MPDFGSRNNQCVRIEVPDNVYLTGFRAGDGWECSYGFVPSEGRCESLNRSMTFVWPLRYPTMLTSTTPETTGTATGRIESEWIGAC